jgi:hypothetical protein
MSLADRLKGGHRHCKYHCGGCGVHFTSLAAFDLHRYGVYEKGRKCRPPEQVRRKDVAVLAVVDPRGSCEMYTDVISPCVVWGIPTDDD